MTDLVKEAVQQAPISERKTLYDLTGHYAAIYQMAQELAMEAEGELPDEIFAALDEAEEDIRNKLEGYGRVMKQLEADASLQAAIAQTYQDEADKYATRARSLRKDADRMKLRVFDALVSTDQKRVETEHFAFWRQASSPSVNVLVDPESLPETYRRVSISADKKALAEALKAGDATVEEYAELEQGEHLRWK